MESGKLETLIYGLIGIIIGLLLCALGIWLFSLETADSTHTYFLMGIGIKGKTLAALVTWLGLITLFFVIRKMRKYLSH